VGIIKKDYPIGIIEITKAKLVIEKLRAKLAMRRAESAPKMRVFHRDFENKK